MMNTLSGEQLIALVTFLVTTISSGIGVAFKRWADAKIARQTALLKAGAEKQAAELKADAEREKALSDAWERLVTSAEKREMAANERTDKTVASMATLTATVGELTTTLKLVSTSSTDMMANQVKMLEEMRKCSQGIDILSRDLPRR